MDIHEYQAKEILGKFGVPIPRAASPIAPNRRPIAPAKSAASKWMVKAQIHTGGRGKAGGVKLCRNEDQVADAADELLGKRLVTHQTGPQARSSIASMSKAASPSSARTLSGLRARPQIGTRDGRGLERRRHGDRGDRRARSPKSIIRSSVEPAVGMPAFQAREIAFASRPRARADRSRRSPPSSAATAPSRSSTRPWWRSIRWSSPRTSASSRSMPR